MPKVRILKAKSPNRLSINRWMLSKLRWIWILWVLLLVRLNLQWALPRSLVPVVYRARVCLIVPWLKIWINPDLILCQWTEIILKFKTYFHLAQSRINYLTYSGSLSLPLVLIKLHFKLLLSNSFRCKKLWQCALVTDLRQEVPD